MRRAVSWGHGTASVGAKANKPNKSESKRALQPTECVADLGVAPAEVLFGELDDESTNVVGPARPAELVALRRAVVLLRHELPKPRQDGRRAYELAAAFPFLGRQSRALERQTSSLLRGEVDPRLSGRDRKRLLSVRSRELMVV